MACLRTGVSLSDRDNLLSLLEHVDTSTNINNLLDKIPLHSFGSLLESRVAGSGGSGDNTRRRHDPCESNDGAGDGNDGDCINRRYNRLQPLMESMKTPDANGITPDSGRLQLREKYASLQTDYASLNSLSGQIYTNITNPTNGSLHMADIAIRKIFNEETLMAQSVNNAWMNLINCTNLASGDTDRILLLRDNVTAEISSWFDSLQLAEEFVTYGNQQTVLSNAWDSLTEAANAISDSQTQVWSALTSLDDSMGGSEDLSQTLSDSLTDTADLVDQALANFEYALQDTSANEESKLNETLDGLVGSYGQFAQSVILGVQNSAASKESTGQHDALVAVAVQNNTIHNATELVENSTIEQIDKLTVARQTFVDYAANLYSAAADRINANITNQTADIQDRQSVVSSNLSDAEGFRSQVASLVSQISSSEKQAMGASGSNRLSQLNTATAAVNNIVVAFSTKSQSVLQMAQQVSSGAIASVGTSSQGPLNDLNSQYDQQQAVAANQANQIALDSQSTSASLANSAALGSNQVSASGGVINGQVDGLASNTMNQVGNLGGSLPGGVDTSGVTGAGTSSTSRGYSSINTAGSNTTNATYTASTEAESELGKEAGDMDATGADAEKTVDETLKGVAVFKSLNNIVKSMSSSTGASVDGSYADASDDIGELSTKLYDMLNDAVQKASGSDVPVVGVSTTMMAAMEAARQLIAQAEQKLDGSTGGTTGLNQTDVMSVIGDALSSVGLSGAQFDSAMASLQKQLQDSVEGSSADVDSFLGSMSSGASDMITDNMKKIETMKTSSAIQITSLDSKQMDKVRAIAANVDALMNQMRNFLSANNPKLFDQVQQLPVVGQRMFLSLNQLRENAYAIRVQAYNTAGGVATDRNYQNLMNQINDFNTTAFDALGQIGSLFNTSTNSYVSGLMGQINDLAAAFQDQANNMKSQLNAIAASASNAEGDLRVTPEGRNVIAQMQTIDSQLAAFADQGNTMISTVSNPSQFARPANYSDMVSSVVKLTNNAGSTDSFVSSLMTNLSSFASSTIGGANSSVQANKQQAVSELSRQSQIASLNAGVAQSQLAARQAAMNELHGDTNNMVADYAQEAKLQAQAQTEKASYVYDSIQSAQADAMTALGNIAKKYASMMSDGSTQTSSNSASSSTATANLRQQIARMAYLFDGYMQSEQRQYANSEDDRSGFTVALLTDVKRKLSALDNALYQIDQQITNQFNQVNGELIGIDSTELDGEIEGLTDALNSWQTEQSGLLTALENNAANVTNSAVSGNAFNYTSIQNQIEKTISIAAQTAVAFIEYYKQPVPANLTDIVNDPVTAFENAYTALATTR